MRHKKGIGGGAIHRAGSSCFAAFPQVVVNRFCSGLTMNKNLSRFLLLVLLISTSSLDAYAATKIKKADLSTRSVTITL